MINTLCSWLHGDERGFRSRSPDIRSSGDYKNPPPPDEYRKLREYFERVARPEVTIPYRCRPMVGRAIVDYLRSQNVQLLALAVGKVHTHLLTELPRDYPTVKRIIGHVKRKSSRAVKKQLPGNVWSAGGEFKPVLHRDHQVASYDYILYDQGPGAWTWSFLDGNNEGMFARKRAPHLQKKWRGPALRSGPP